MKLSEFVNSQKTNTPVAETKKAVQPTTAKAGKLSAFVAENNIKPESTTPISMNIVKGSSPITPKAPSTLERVGDTVLGTVKQMGADNLGAINILGKGMTKLSLSTGGADRQMEQMQKDIAYYQKLAQDTSISAERRAAAQKTADALVAGYDKNKAMYANNTNEQITANAYAPLDTTISNVQSSANENMTLAKEGLGKFGRFAVDVGSGALQLAGDIGVGAVTGGGALVPMALRSFGGGAQQAEQGGAGLGKQIAYGTLQAGTAALTEGLSNVGGVLSKAFGKGVADKALESGLSKFISKIIKNEAISSRLATALGAGVGEGLEEVLQSALTPIYQKITYDPNVKYDSDTVSNMLYDGLVGAVLGGALGGVGGSNVDTQTNIPSDNVNYTAQTGANNVQVVPNNMQNSGQNVQKTSDNVQNNVVAPNIPKANFDTTVANENSAKANAPQQAVQASTIDVKPQTTTDTAKAESVPVEEQAKAESNPAPTRKELLEKANAYTDEYYMSLDETTTQEEMKSWRRIRDKMLEKYLSETSSVSSEVSAKYKEGQYVRTQDGKEGKITSVGEYDGIPTYSIVTDNGNEYSAIKQYYLDDISESKSIRDSFAESISNKAQKTKAVEYLKENKNQEWLDKLASNPNTKAEKETFTHSKKDGGTFTTSKYRIYDGENQGKTFVEVPKIAFDYYNFKKSPSIFPSTSLGAKITNGMPQGTGAASKNSLGGMGATKPTRFPVNDQANVDLNNLPQMSNQVVMNPQSKKTNIAEKLSRAYTRTVDTINPIVKFSRATGDNTAMLASNASSAGGTVSNIIEKSLVDMNGNKIGKSLKEITDKIPKDRQVDFWNYMMQRRNINRAVVDTNLIANFNSKMSAQYAKEIETANPTWKWTGDDIVKWIADFEQAWGVDSGLIDQEFFNQLKLKDPNYVPAQREFTELESALTGGEVGKKFVDQNTPLKKMEGSERDINNPLENIMNLVNTTVKTARYNQVGQSLLKTLRRNPKASQYGEIISEDEAKASSANNIVTVIENGQKQYIRINDIDLLQSLNGLPKSTFTVPVLSNLTTGFKKITTQDNPLFGITNLARDLPTGYIYGSQWNPFTYLLNEGKAFGQIAKNGANYQRYKAVGGGMSSFFSSADSETAALNLNKTKNVFQKVGIGFNKFNSMIEEATRLNEFSAVLAKTGDVQKALNAANDVTVNFSRGGDIIKTVDRNGVPYLNASIQGLDKLGKAFKPDRIAKTLFTGAVGITLPTLILYLFNRDNPYYDELSNRTKDTYFVIPNMFGEKDNNGNAMTFIKIPKSRELGMIFGALAERIAREVDGEDEAFKGFAGTLATNISPTNPLESGLIAPLIGLKSNKDFAGRTIIPQSMQDRSKSLQFDEKTSELTKFIAEYAAKAGIELSPKEMDYLIDSWTGVVGDFLLPATTKGANALSPITNKFTADPRYSSQTITDFYDKMDEAAKKANDRNFAEGLDSETVTLEEKISSNYAKASKEISALSKASARAGVEKLTGEDIELLKEYGIDTTKEPQDIQKAIRTEQNKIASAAIGRGTKADEMELDLNNNSDIAKKVEKYQSAGITQKQAYDFYKSTADIDSDDKYSMVKAISGKGYTDKQAIALVGTLYTDSSKESMLPYLTTSKHLLSLYLTNKDSEMISMSVPSTVTKDKVDYELTDSEKEAFKNTYANYFNSRVTNISTAEQVKKLRDKAYEAAKLAVIQSR